MSWFHSPTFACLLTALFLLAGMSPILAGINKTTLPDASLVVEIHHACATAGSNEIAVLQETDSKAKVGSFDDCVKNSACCIASIASPYIHLATFNPEKDDLFIESDDLVFQADRKAPYHPPSV